MRELNFVLDTLPYGIIETIKAYIGSKTNVYVNRLLEKRLDELQFGDFPIEEALEFYFNTYICREEAECFIHLSATYYEKVKAYSQWHHINDRQLIEAILFYHTIELEMEELEKKERYH